MFDKRFSKSKLSICGCLKIYHIGTLIMTHVVKFPLQIEHISTEKVNRILDLIVI